jgi:hypothetical protein
MVEVQVLARLHAIFSQCSVALQDCAGGFVIEDPAAGTISSSRQEGAHDLAEKLVRFHVERGLRSMGFAILGVDS